MQKRVVGNINELNEASRKTAFEESANTAGADRGGCKANKTSFGRFKKFAVIIMLLIVSVFCAIGSADWIISQQEQLPGGSGSTFVYDKKTLQNYIALKGSDETEAAAKVAEAEEYASLQTETDSDDSAVADKFIVKKAAVSKKSAVSTYANGLESAIYGKSAIYNGKPIVAIKKTAGIDNAAADLPDDVLNGSLLTSYKPLTDGSVTEADLTEADFAEGATSGLPQNAGTYAILVKIKGLKAYGYAVKIFTILPCPVTVGWSGIDFANGFTYDGAAHPVTAAAKIASSDNGNIEGSEVNANLSVSIAKDGVSVSEVKTAGDYTLTAASGNDNYYISSGETTSFTVSKREATAAITLSQIEIDFGSEVPTATIKYSGVISGDTLGAPKLSFVGESGGYKKGSDVGTYTIGITGGLDNENYSITTFSASFTVTPYRLTIEWSDTDLKYTGKEQKPKATIKNPIEGLTAPTVTVTTYISGNDTPISTSAVGEYIAKASVSDGNYSIASGGTTEFTISRIQVAIPTSGDNMLEHTGSELTYKLSGFDGSTMTITGNTGSYITEDAYKAVVSLKDSAYEWSDKTTEPKTFAWYIVPTLVKFDGILEKTYEEAKSGITLDANVFTNLVFKNGEKANTQASGAASTIKVTDGNGNDYTETSPNNVIKVGSTYKAEIKLVNNYCFDIQVDETANKCTFSRSGTTYIKYKTAKIGESFFTIEDALAQAGDIHLAGDSTNNSSDENSYVITAFSKLGLSSSVDSAFSDYKYDYAYTLNGKKLVASYNDSTTTRTTDKSVTSYGNVYSALILHKNITLTLSSSESSSATLAAAAKVGFNQEISTTLANVHGVIMNNGKIIVNSGCTVEANGYIKGSDESIIELKSGATAIDALSIYDWPGGRAALGMYKNVFPTNAYTVHNISCPVKVYSGAIYKANAFLTVTGAPPIDKSIIIVGTTSNKGMFNADNSSGYVMKSVTTNAADKGSSKDINYNIALSNQRAEASVYNTFNHRDNIVVNGKYSDSPISIEVSLATLQTSTSIPLPIGFMDITIKENASLTLTSSDYLILPGATLKIESKGTLNLGSNVDIVAMPYISMPTGGRVFLHYYTSATDGSGKEDGKLIINGTLTGNNYNLGGNILTESENSTLTVFNASGSYITMISTASPYYKSGTSRATGNIITDRSNYGEANFSTGTYYSKNVGTADSPVYAWFKNTATVTYVLNDGTLNGSQENHVETLTLTANGYTDMPVPSKPYYTFGGWFFDSDLSEPATSVYTSCTLYAKWNPIEYTVKYHFASIEYGTLNDEKLSGNEIKALSNPPKEQLTINGTTLTFAGWYLTSDYSGNSVSSVSAANADNSKIINVYANFINADTTYNVFFELNPEGITDNTAGMIALDFDKKSVHKGEATEISSLVDILSIYNYNTDYKSNYYFSGWYLSTDETQTVITVLPSTISEDLTLFAKWEKKNSVTIRSSIEVSLKTSDGQTEVAIGPGEEKLLYLYKGATLSLEDKKELHKNGFNSTKTVYTEHSLILSETENGTNATPYSITSDITLYIRCDEVTYHQVDITVRLGNSKKFGLITLHPKNASVTINSSSYYDINGEKKTGNITLENSTERAGDEKYLSVYLPIGTYTPSGSNTASITPTSLTITKDTTTVTTVLAQGKDR